NVFSTLKFRGGFGITGTEPGSSYISLSRLNFNTYAFINGNWIQTANPSTNPNPDLKWERKEELNFGVDYSILGNRISGSVDYYVRTTKDLIANCPVSTPPYLYSSVTANAASIENKGVEVQINAEPIVNSNIQWNTSVNYSTN